MQSFRQRKHTLDGFILRKVFQKVTVAITFRLISWNIHLHCRLVDLVVKQRSWRFQALIKEKCLGAQLGTGPRTVFFLMAGWKETKTWWSNFAFNAKANNFSKQEKRNSTRIRKIRSKCSHLTLSVQRWRKIVKYLIISSDEGIHERAKSDIS